MLNNSTYSGYSVDVISHIAKKKGFQYELYSSPDGSYGRFVFERENGTWTGMIKEVQDKV